jgi:hypothetical protein
MAVIPRTGGALSGSSLPEIGDGVVLAPELRSEAPKPPQPIISFPVQIAVWPDRPDGTPTPLVGIQSSVTGS